MFYIVYYGLIGKRYFGPRRRCVSYMEFAPLAPPLYFGIQTMPRSCKRSSTLRNESGNRTYSITARRMISGLVLKYLNGGCFVIRRGYKAARPVSSSFCLTLPMQTLIESPSHGHRHARILLSWSRKAGRTGSGGRTLISARRANPLAPSNRQYGHVRARLYPHVPANEVPVCSRLTTTTASLASQLGSTGFLSAWRSPRERRYQLL